MAKEKFDAEEFISSLFHYAHDFNYNHIVFEANRYKVSVNLTRRSATYGNADMFYVSADTKSFAPVMSAINGAIEVAELASKQQAVVETAAMFDGTEGALGRSMTLEDMELMTWAIFQSGQKIPAKVYSKILAQWDLYSYQMAVFHEAYDILLTPTVADVTPKHGQFALSESLQNQLKQIAYFDWPKQQELIWTKFADSLDWTSFTQRANLTGQPSISLPIYRNADGLSLGVQLTSAKGREDLLLLLAKQMEESSILCKTLSNSVV